MQSLLILLVISPILQLSSSQDGSAATGGAFAAAFAFLSPSSTTSITRIGGKSGSHQYDRSNHLLSNDPIHRLYSTPFDLDLYNDNSNPEDDDDESSEDLNQSPLAVPPSTQLILGINKYSHDTTLCAADAQTSQVLFAISKERLTRSKHDGGNIATLVETCLDCLELDIDNIAKVVMNNHHHRILPLIESDIDHMEWEEGLSINGGVEEGYSDEYNVLESIEDKMELSHHLAHAYSVCAQAPFDNGMVVVMDGMGETYRVMKQAVEMGDTTYVSDFSLVQDSEGEEMEIVPRNLDELAKTSYYDWREAESVYTFVKDETGLKVKVSVFHINFMIGCLFVYSNNSCLNFFGVNNNHHHYKLQKQANL